MAAINEIALGEHLRSPVGFDTGASVAGKDAGRVPDATAILAGAGSSADRALIAVADKRFLCFYTESTATSGDSRGIYWQHFLSGAGATGDCARFFCKVNATGVAGGFGVHSTVQIQDDATTGITGLANGVRATLAAEADTRTLGGTMAALQVDSDIGANNTLPAQTAMIRVADNNTVKIPNFLSVASGAGCYNTETPTTVDASLSIYIEGVGTRYIPIYTTLGS
jgi:hypothetical protein